MKSEYKLEDVPGMLEAVMAKLNKLENMMASIIPQAAPSPKYVDINGASKITGKSPNALRVQISLGSLKSVKRGSRHYFESEYLEKWLSGRLDE